MKLILSLTYAKTTPIKEYKYLIFENTFTCITKRSVLLRAWITEGMTSDAQSKLAQS